MKKILVYGSKVFAKVIKSIVEECGHTFVGYIDDFNEGGRILGTFDDVVERFSPADHEIVIAVGYDNLSARWRVFERVVAAGYHVPALIHPGARVHNLDNIDDGSVIMVGAIIDINAHIGKLCVAWPGVVINHDTTVEKNTFLSPNATICGCVSIGANSFIGAGATVVDHVTVAPDSFIKAGGIYSDKRKRTS